MHIRLPYLVRSLPILLLFLVSACSPAATQSPGSKAVKPEFEKYFQEFDGAFVLYDLNNNRYTRYNPERCAGRSLPASTYKIMNALIALETGVVKDQNYVIAWDGTQYPNPVWNQDHTLKSAFRDSVVWYYQEVARQIGRERMQHYLDAVGYGNQVIGEKLDFFWLDGYLQISADEQVEFLKRLYQGDLPFSKRTMDIVKDILLLESDSVYQLRGKTGSGQIGDLYVGWFVGYQEADGNVYVFAANITSARDEAKGSKAKEIVLGILQE